MFVRKSTKDSTPLLHRLVVAKHGSHNQSSHGRGSKGGGGGGGGSASSTNDTGRGRDDKLVDDLANDVEDLKGRLDTFTDNQSDIEASVDEVAIGRVSDSLDAATQNMDRAVEMKDDKTHGALMDTAQGHLQDAKAAASFGSKKLKDKFERPISRLADQALDYTSLLDSD